VIATCDYCKHQNVLEHMEPCSSCIIGSAEYSKFEPKQCDICEAQHDPWVDCELCCREGFRLFRYDTALDLPTPIGEES